MNRQTFTKHIISLLAITAISFTIQAQQKNISLTSPDGTIKVAVALGDKITYSIYERDVMLLKDNEIQLQLRNETLGLNPKLTGQKTASADTEFQPVVPFKFSTVKNKYNSLTLNFSGNYSLEFRAFDDGVAYRFVTKKKGTIDVMHETCDLYFPDNYMLHIQQGNFNSYYESAYKHVEARRLNPGETFTLLPVLIDTKMDRKILFSEADLNDYPCMFFRGQGEKYGLSSVFPHTPTETVPQNDREIFAVKEADYIARTAGTREFPWRFFIIAKNDNQLIESTMIARLVPHDVNFDTSWIKPGMSAWDWMNRWADYGPEVDYQAGVSTAAYKHYIDFASRNHIPYLILDEGWSQNNAHPKEIRPAVDLQELVRYGKEKNVELLLWITYRGIQEDFDDDSFNLFEYFSGLGIRGFKIDFMDRSDQAIVNFYEKAAAEAAKYKMLVELHGSYKPTGLEYRYPNILSFEGVRGMENGGNCTPENNLWMPFMRNVVGPMSFTPGSMLNVQPEHFNRLGPNMVMIGTRVHHIAYYILFESGLQMISDSPRQFDQNPDCRDFIFSTPVTWDETKALASEAGKYAIVAKRNGTKWWIGGITNNDEKTREFDLALDFLPSGKTFTMTIFEDGLNADRQAMDYTLTKKEVRQGDKIHVRLARNGGIAAVLE